MVGGHNKSIWPLGPQMPLYSDGNWKGRTSDSCNEFRDAQKPTMTVSSGCNDRIVNKERKRERGKRDRERKDKERES